MKLRIAKKVSIIAQKAGKRRHREGTILRAERRIYRVIRKSRLQRKLLYWQALLRFLGRSHEM